VHRPAGAPYHFSYARFDPAPSWTARFFTWSDSTDPRKQAAAFARLLETTPIVTQQTPRLDYVWYSPTIKGVPQSKFAVVVTGRITLPAGAYTLRSISDDGVRVFVDNKLAIDDWTPHESTVDVAPLAGGAHELRVEYYQVDGWTELRLDVVRGTQRAGGSPGPH
jgi:hypothetical protein